MSSQDAEEAAHNFSSDSEDELDWEEVAVPQAEHLVVPPEDQAEPRPRPNIEVTLDAYSVKGAKGKDDAQYVALFYLGDGGY